ncbi:MAG: hypothetical protein GY869_18420 [Planctomycetes bacterium]|nr:hypothetical protein [Planctomycetota bacterium]
MKTLVVIAIAVKVDATAFSGGTALDPLFLLDQCRPTSSNFVRTAGHTVRVTSKYC